MLARNLLVCFQSGNDCTPIPPVPSYATGFNAIGKDRNQIGEVKLAGDKSESKIRIAVSGNPSVVGELPQLQYRYRSPAYALGHLGRTFEVGSDTHPD